MKKRMILIAVFSLNFSIAIFAQTKMDHVRPATLIVQNTAEIKLPAPPSKEQTLREIEVIKKLQSSLDEAAISRIKYWDAGAPSYHWNQLAYQLTGAEFTKPYGGQFWRCPTAWMNLAIYDATVTILEQKKNHARKRPFETDPSIRALVTTSSTSSYPCEHAATASAAANVLGYFFPAVKDSLLDLARQAMQSRVDAGVQYPSDVAEGWKIGEEIAGLVIEREKKHTAGRAYKGIVPNDPGKWTGEYPVGAITTTFKPLVLKSASQFRPPAPPEFGSEMKALKDHQQNFYTICEAYKWASHSGLDIWTDLASQKIFENKLDKDPLAASRIYTLLHTTFYDVAIAIMDAKYAYHGIRPFQYDRNFKPLLGFTPPFPGYPSGHATASAAAASVLSHFFPADATYFKKLAEECANSRFYAGIHFPTDNQVGLEMGTQVGEYIVSKMK